MYAAIWGTGNIAHTHAQALIANGITIKAVVNRHVEKAKAFADKWGVEIYSDDSAVLLDDEICCVHVCTPPNLHYEMIMMLLEHQKHIICEKPLCFDDDQAMTLVRVAREKNLICAINFNVRFHLACQKAREIVSASDFGRPMLIHGNYLQEFNAFPAPLDWRYNETLAGRMRAVTEIGSHWMDIAQYISGRKIVAVSALFGRYNPIRYLEEDVMYPDDNAGARPLIKIKSEDAALIIIKFEDGAIGSVALSEISQGRINRLTLEVTGERKNLWWNSEDNNMLHTATKGSGVNTEVIGFGNGFSDTFNALINQVYRDVATGKPSEIQGYPTFEEGARIVRICNAILESADHDSKWVTIE